MQGFPALNRTVLSRRAGMASKMPIAPAEGVCQRGNDPGPCTTPANPAALLPCKAILLAVVSWVCGSKMSRLFTRKWWRGAYSAFSRQPKKYPGPNSPSTPTQTACRFRWREVSNRNRLTTVCCATNHDRESPAKPRAWETGGRHCSTRNLASLPSKRGYLFFAWRYNGGSARVNRMTCSPVTVLTSWCRLNTGTLVISRISASRTGRAVSTR
jgi:hypothetical protein